MNIQHLYYYYYCIIAITLYGALVVTLAILLRLINCRFIIIITNIASNIGRTVCVLVYTYIFCLSLVIDIHLYC